MRSARHGYDSNVQPSADLVAEVRRIVAMLGSKPASKKLNVSETTIDKAFDGMPMSQRAADNLAAGVVRYRAVKP